MHFSSTMLLPYPMIPLVDATIQTLASKQLLVVDEQRKVKCWKDFDEKRCSSAQEPKVLRRVEAIASHFAKGIYLITSFFSVHVARSVTPKSKGLRNGKCCISHQDTQ
jgi:hypothetical protein